MALTEVSNQDKKTPEKSGVEKKEKLPTKVVIRRLPPQMDQATFLNQISPIPNYDYFYMVKGDLSLGENSFARAYINFTNPDDVYDFKEKFDNYVFLDNAGHEYSAVVEFAAFQKIPKRRNKMRVDLKCGSIESDPIYLEFVEMINKPPEQDENKPEYSLQLTSSDVKNDETTPLLEYIKNKKAERMRIREERREERKRREFERKKYKDEEWKKGYDERPVIKSKPFKSSVSEAEKIDKESVQEKSDLVDEKPEKFEKSYYKSRDKKYDERPMKDKYTSPKYPLKKEYTEKREFKRRDEYKEYKSYNRPKFDDYKKEIDPKIQQKKVKKYSEKREERKIEAQKAEQKKLEQLKETEIVKITEVDKPSTSKSSSVVEDKGESPNKEEKQEKVKICSEKEDKSKIDSQSQKRIRNKDRPTIAIYRPGMLSKRKQVEGESEKEQKKE